jgi:hypothetical protein
MANPMPDCSQIPQLLTAINNTSAELSKLRGEMDALGFGTAKTLRLVVRLQKFISVYENLPDEVFLAAFEFVRCNDSVLADLTAEQLQKLVRALVAHAELQIEAIPEEKVRTPEQAALLEAFKEWLPELNNIAAQFATVGKDKLVSLIKAAKQTIKTAAPIVLRELVALFSEEIKQAIINKAIAKITDRKTLISKLAEQVVKAALGKAAADKVSPYIGIALTGYELLVELAGNAAATDMRAYVDQLLVKLVDLLQDCKYTWPQPIVTDPDGNKIGGFFLKGEKYKGAKVVARPFIRCAKLVDGKPQFGDPCPVMFTTGATVTAKMTEEIRANGRWTVSAIIDMNSVTNSPCLTNAKYCYAYFELKITLADGTKLVMNVICGAKSF